MNSTITVLVAVVPTVSVFFNSEQDTSGNSSIKNLTIVPVYSSPVLHCFGKGYPDATFQWFHNDLPLLDGISYDSNDRSHGYLVIKNVTSYNEGTYKCVAGNIAGENSGSTELQIAEHPTIIRDQRIQVFHNQVTKKVDMGGSVQTVAGSTILIRCHRKDKQGRVTMWMKDGKKLCQSRATVNGVFTLPDIQKEDSGKYTCLAENQLGKDIASIQIHILDAPEINYYGFHSLDDSRQVIRTTYAANDTLLAVKGRRLALMCKVSGFPMPRISWLQNFHHLSSRLNYRIKERVIFRRINGYRQPFTESILILNQLSERSSGIYSCQAASRLGATRRKIVVRVDDPPRSPYSGLWIPSVWSDCALSQCHEANTASQNRHVSCVTIFGHPTVDEKCDPSTKPKSRQECIASHCSLSWRTSEWNKCSSTCGVDGWQDRDVYCTYTASQQRRPSDECDSLKRRKPATKRACNRYECKREKCVDAFTYCRQIPRMQFCDIESYKTNCCKSCVSF